MPEEELGNYESPAFFIIILVKRSAEDDGPISFRGGQRSQLYKFFDQFGYGNRQFL